MRPFAEMFREPIERAFDEPISEKIGEPLKKALDISEQLLATEWQTLQELWRKLAAEVATFAPNLTDAIDRLAQLETNLIEITGIPGQAFTAQTNSVVEDFHKLREHVSAASQDVQVLRRFNENRDFRDMAEAAAAGLRFVVAAIAIIRFSLQIVDRLNPKKVIRRTFDESAGARA
jgi:hypothetical protein